MVTFANKDWNHYDHDHRDVVLMILKCLMQAFLISEGDISERDISEGVYMRVYF